jgi:hypothetical protein
VKVAKDMMMHATDIPLKEESFLSICDLLIFFAHVGEGAGQITLAPLQYRADQNMGECLNYFIQVSPIRFQLFGSERVISLLILTRHSCESAFFMKQFLKFGSRFVRYSFKIFKKRDKISSLISQIRKYLNQ